MKKRIILLLVLTLVFPMIVMATGGGEEDGKIVIGASHANFNDKWLLYLIDAQKEWAEEHAGEVEVLFVDANEDLNTQVQQFENFVQQGVDAIVATPIGTDVETPLAGIAKNAGIPYVAINRMPADYKNCAAYVGSNSVTAGEMQMKGVSQIRSEGNMAILYGMAGHEAATGRTQGYYNIIEKQGLGVKEVANQIVDWQRDKALDIVENWLESDLEINMINANNDEGAIGAILAFQSSGREDEVLNKTVIISGVDATPDALEFMKKGLLHVTVYQNPVGQGKVGLDAALAMAKGESVDFTEENIIWVPYELVTEDLVDEYIAKWK